MSHSTDEPLTTTQLTLQTMRLGMQMSFSREFLSQLSWQENYLRDTLELVWRGRQYYLPGDVLEVPLTWWDHAKQRLQANRKVPAWLRARVKEVRTARHEALAMIPDMPVAQKVLQYELFPGFREIEKHRYDPDEEA